MRMLSIRISFPIFQRPFVIEVDAEHMRKELVRMLSIRVRNCAYASVPYAYAQHARQKLNGLAPSKIKIIG
jgi:hypothetical protein